MYLQYGIQSASLLPVLDVVVVLLLPDAPHLVLIIS